MQDRCSEGSVAGKKADGDLKPSNAEENDHEGVGFFELVKAKSSRPQTSAPRNRRR